MDTEDVQAQFFVKFERKTRGQARYNVGSCQKKEDGEEGGKKRGKHII